MKTLFHLLTFLILCPALAQNEHFGPSALEREFFRQSNLRMPIVQTAISGLNFDFLFQRDKTNGTEEDLHEDSTGLTINVGPFIHGNVQRFKRKINEETSTNDDNVIEQASPNSPYVLAESRNWDLGAGLAAILDISMPILNTGVVGANIAFLKGKNYFSIRKFTSSSEKRPRLTLPLTNEDLLNWKVGDQLYYATRGGVVFNVFLGFRPFISIGPKYVHSGSYRIRAHLAKPDVMEVEVTTTQTKSTGFEAANLPIKLEKLNGKGHLDAVMYEFDLKDEGAIRAMAYLFHGRIDLTNREMLASGGKIKFSTRLQHTFATYSGRYGIPFLITVGGDTGLSRSNGIVTKEENGEMNKYEMTTSSDSQGYYTRGALSNKKLFNQVTSSTLARKQKGDNSFITSFYSWSISKSDMKKSLLKKKLWKLSEVFGIPRLKKLVFPLEKMGYLKTDFNVNFSGGDILYLLDTSNLKAMEEDALDSLARDFKLKGHRAFCKVRRYYNCLKRHEELVKKKHSKIQSLAKALEADYKNNKIQEVTTKLTKIIRQLFSSRYLIQAYTKMRPLLDLELRLEGEKIKKHRVRL